MACEHPQAIQTAHKRYRYVPCGQCYTCRRRTVRTHQGKALMEYQHPAEPLHLKPDLASWWTLTYRDTPMTEPKRHEPGWIDPVTLWSGPFDQPNRGSAEFPQRLGVVDGAPAWIEPDGHHFLTENEVIDEQLRTFENKYGWDRRQIKRYFDGDYDPAPTLHYAHVQSFLKRLRIESDRKLDLGPLRFQSASEYGGVTDRPHYHLALWGLPQEHHDLVHDLWEDYHGGGHVFPDRHQAVNFGKGVMRGRAATYQAKDLSKSRHHWLRTPSQFARERPRVEGSRRPPLGEGYFDSWIHDQIAPVFKMAMLYPIPSNMRRDVFVCRWLRKSYVQVNVPTPSGKIESFPTSQTWRSRCRQVFGIPDSVWSLATEQENAHEAIRFALIQRNIAGLGDDHRRAVEQIRQSSIEKRTRELDRIAKRRSQLEASGKI